MADSAPASVVLKFPLGTDNRSREYELPDGSLRACVNLDVTRGGGVRCRDGLRAVWSGAAHSLYATPHFLLGVFDGSLSVYRDGTVTALVAVTPGLPVRYALLAGEVYWTNGAEKGRVSATGSALPWGLPTPPSLAAVAGTAGGLDAGVYQVNYTAIDSSGLESGAPACVEVTVPQGGGITVTTPPSLPEFSFRLYRSPRAGGASELREFATLAGGTTAIFGQCMLGKRLESLLAVPPLPGQCLVSHKGRLWTATDSVVWFSSEKSPHWLFPAFGYYRFESAVTLLAPAEDGLYVATAERTYYLQGKDPNDMTQRSVASVGAVRGSDVVIAADLYVGDGGFPGVQSSWMDSEGYLCVGKAGGVIVRPSKQRYCAGGASFGLAAQRQAHGMRQIITALDGTGAEVASNAADDTTVAEVFANGVVLGA